MCKIRENILGDGKNKDKLPTKKIIFNLNTIHFGSRLETLEQKPVIKDMKKKMFYFYLK